MKSDIQDPRVDEFARRLSRKGYRVTRQRLHILEAILNARDHPSAVEVFARVSKTCPSTSLGTVYRTLSTLKDMGEITELQFRDGSNRYDGNQSWAHSHAVCTRCGHIEDMDMAELKAMEARAADSSGFLVKASRIEFYGLCPKCRLDPDVSQ